VSLLLFASVTQPQTLTGVPVYRINRAASSIRFAVKASVAIAGTFDHWDAALAFTSLDPATGVLDVKIQAASVDTGSGMKNGKLRGNDFFNAKQDPFITFRSNRFVRTSPSTFEVDGDFTIRGVTKPERLTLTITDTRVGSGTIAGTMAFDRKEYGMNSGIPFIRIADYVEVAVKLAAKRVSGPPLLFRP
jgi:polyisoprenoid-binding protein YceI